MSKAVSIYSVYMPPLLGLPFLSVIIRPGRQSEPLVTSFATQSEAEDFNREMEGDLIQ